MLHLNWSTIYIKITADALYSGRNIDEFIDCLSEDAIKIERTTKKKTIKKVNKKILREFNNGK